ncbi:PHP domain-containing protein [Dissulfurirhabdus thermomarina]|uniref:PHP domain-containing protein n=1 Tax=Dissulfurirhabdus thermomarina TaxID=1765737 RepID=A0A6N9TKJ1_DISTH|nr:PHP domain-containing protein [Dissulfurirhabdus thermomarina]NDY41629.1 PHP domain-containing protein [Dissulfurirhabdus thermomarina]NMX23328.1 PHP domain-containing protein [Dissulfurirhabdus thermomarina]
MFRFDLHVHTEHSPCSRLETREILRNARRMGLDGVCITDHDTMAARREVVEGLQDDGLCVVIGMEYTTPEGDFLLFGPFEDLPPGLPAQALLRLVAQVDGAAVAAHPFRRGRGVAEALVRGGLCRVVEGRNGRNTPEEDAAVRPWAEAYGVGLAGGSDAHALHELGRVVTGFHQPVRNRDDLVAQLNRGRFLPLVLHRPVVFPAGPAPRPVHSNLNI